MNRHPASCLGCSERLRPFFIEPKSKWCIYSERPWISSSTHDFIGCLSSLHLFSKCLLRAALPPISSFSVFFLNWCHFSRWRSVIMFRDGTSKGRARARATVGFSTGSFYTETTASALRRLWLVRLFIIHTTWQARGCVLHVKWLYNTTYETRKINTLFLILLPHFCRKNLQKMARLRHNLLGLSHDIISAALQISFHLIFSAPTPLCPYSTRVLRVILFAGSLLGWWIHFNLPSLAPTSGTAGQDISLIAYPERSIM